MAAGANAGFGLAERAAVFLPGTIIVGGLAILVHGQPGRADWITGRNRFRGFRTAWIERDKSLAIIDRFYRIVDAFRIVALVGKEGAFLQRNRLIRGREELSGDGGISDIARRGQLIERQTGDAVHQYMAFVPPVERIPPLIVLVGSRMDAQSAVRVAFGVVFLGELAFCISPIGRQRLHDIEPAVVGNEPVVVQIIHQICDLRETLAFHNDKSTDHGFFRKAPPPGCRSGQREVQAAEKLVVEHGGALGCEQRHILNDFLSVDSGQPLSGWFSLQANFTKKGLRFLYHLSDFRLQPWPESIAVTAFLAFCSWLISYKTGGRNV